MMVLRDVGSRDIDNPQMADRRQNEKFEIAAVLFGRARLQVDRDMLLVEAIGELAHGKRGALSALLSHRVDIFAQLHHRLKSEAACLVWHDRAKAAQTHPSRCAPIAIPQKVCKKEPEPIKWMQLQMIS